MNSKLLGSTLIVAGTALGAGMLAIPMVLAQFGLIAGSLLMLFIYVGTTYAALLLLEASCKVGGSVSMNAIAKYTLGKGGQVITNGLLYALLVCLLMAYILGAGDLLNKLLGSISLLSDNGVSLSATESQIIFTLVAGVIVSSGTSVVDKLNRFLFFAMVASLVVTLFALVPGINSEHLFAVSVTNHTELIKNSSVLFTSFGFMVVIPSLVSYNSEATNKQLQKMIIVGSTIPLVCYFLWLAAAIGNLSIDQLVHFANVSELINALSANYPWLNGLLSLFTGLALLTSFLGVALALYHQNIDVLGCNRFVGFIITFILPLIGAVLAANEFLAILGYAGIILVFLAVFIPVAMIVRLRSGNLSLPDSNMTRNYQAAGGVVALVVTLAFGGFLLYSELI
ncbi:tyrosine transporter [Vibrio sp. SS-MA-C1-2]|uniref:amino acid permease n=1 Tax=Vibrio sp. SS-MA-C1-2 TaxID=2908646 RepID=UPI001F4595BC|nr:aromatic amino acid transport family protein [Vibrio sp. SS-MA-C1-2]UJF17767.1 tyrosine transporter [Vibrio sp. SS-MA-C1-2]